MDIQGYLNEIRALHDSGQSTEHSFRPALARLFASIDPSVRVINEPKQTAVGAPDFVFQRNSISIGWCEAKDIGKDIRKFATGDYSKEQKARYIKGLPNLIYTNGLDFEFIINGETVAFITIGDVLMGIQDRADQFGSLESWLKNFVTQTPVSITTAKQLAEMMAGKAALIKDIMGRALVADQEAKNGSDLLGQYQAFKAHLIHDITIADFADVYAETIAYGLFAARLHDQTQATFSRTEALELLPKSNPFLRDLFLYIAGPSLDDRLVRMIDDLCEIFRATSLHDLLRDFGKFTARNDPFIHFYETFLAEYNPAKRKARGVWYTPEPVVNFIVRAVDDVLKTEFGLADGLADTSKVTVDWDTGQTDNKGKAVTIKKEVHRVQVLDPATGTGTFLAEVIRLVGDRVKGMAPGSWSTYVEQDLIPRLHGFELLMASYAMCHMKLDMMLTEMGYTPSGEPPRLSVYLTNSLEEGERVERNLFGLARSITIEAEKASEIKRDQPIMCVIGNPPYSISSSNQGTWINNLISEYKEGLNEQNVQAISDDYIKFIRLAQKLIDDNGSGVVGFITNNAYIDGLIQRDMRKSLFESFDKIYIFDLHGSVKRREKASDGTADRNVFDIQQGVSIAILVKNPLLQKQLYHRDIFGSRESKYASLFSASISDPNFAKFDCLPPNFYFVPKTFYNQETYSSGFRPNDLFIENGTGIKFRKDQILISKNFSISDVKDMIRSIINDDNSILLTKYGFNETSDWKIDDQRANFIDALDQDIRMVKYRPFDRRFCYYPYDKINKIVPRGDSRRGLMKHMFESRNVCLVLGRQGQVVGNEPWNLTFTTSELVDQNIFYRGGGLTCPLYLYPEEGTLDQSIRLNFEPKLYAQIRAAAGLTGPLVAPDGSDAFRAATGDARPDEVKVFDYIYGVLHCPAYRATYAEFLKIDFPRIPFPHDPASFADISANGEALRRLHLMEPAAIGETPFPFEGAGNSEVVKPRHEGGKVWINDDQGFANVSTTAWEFHIGGYQPAQKWLKDRKGRTLSWEDVRHYQRIIKILDETARIMATIEVPLD